MTSTIRPTLFTIGHGTLPWSVFRDLLERHGIQTVVDVRSQPYSAHAPVYTKADLETALRAAGFGYRWMGDRLGGRPSDPALQDAQGEPDWQAVTATARFASAVTEVAGLAEGSVLALLCAERDPTRCHRETVLADRFEDAGFLVLHVLADGSLRPHQPGLGI